MPEHMIAIMPDPIEATTSVSWGHLEQMSSAPIKARISFKVGSSTHAFAEENELENWISQMTEIVASGISGTGLLDTHRSAADLKGEVQRREALVNRILAHQIHRYVGMDEILLEGQQELEERVDKWLGVHEKDAS
jgi:hypothetical protein